MSGIAVEIKGVGKRFGPVDAVRDISIAIRRGEFLTLLGPSGCGKTTLLRMLAGFEHPTSGEIRINGTLVNHVPAHKRPIGMVFQNLALFPHLTVAENVAFGLRSKGMLKADIPGHVERALALVGLPDFGPRRIGEMSGGQRQRVALARSLVPEPAVLLLDEPLSALDLKLRRQMQIELKAIQQRVGTTFVFVTHDQEEALAMSDRIAVMNGGRIEQLGSGEEVYHQPTTSFVARFVGETNFWAGRVAERDGALATVEIEKLGSITLPAGDAAPGQPVGLCLRPEHVLLGEAASASPLRIQGRVTGRHYGGSSVRYEFDAPGGAVIARLPSGPGGHALTIGDQVVLGIDPAMARLVPAT
jgi:putative spermidine/putrescine transport system ATP-binding protein